MAYLGFLATEGGHSSKTAESEDRSFQDAFFWAESICYETQSQQVKRCVCIDLDTGVCNMYRKYIHILTQFADRNNTSAEGCDSSKSRFVGCLVGGPAVDGALDDALDL